MKTRTSFVGTINRIIDINGFHYGGGGHIERNHENVARKTEWHAF